MGKSGGREPRKNYEKLLSELQREFASTSTDNLAQQPNTSKVVPFSGGFPDDDASWHRAKSNVTIKYAIHFGVIHDKSCPQIQSLPSHNLEFVKEYPDKGVQCCNCAVKAYIRNGAMDIANIDKYVAFFHRVNWKAKSIGSLYITHGARTRIDTDVLTIWYKEDTWKIRAHPDSSKVDLLHNNYTLQDGQRVFTEGFHLQKKNTIISDAVNHIYSYEYSDHFRRYEDNEDTVVYSTETPVPLEELPATEDRSTTPSATTVMISHRVEPSLPKVVKPAVQSQTHSEKLSLKEKIIYRLLRMIGSEKHIRIDGLMPISYAGRPEHGEICVILWNASDEKKHWIVASYSSKKSRFAANMGGYQVQIDEEKVIAWKSLDLLPLATPPTDGTTGIYYIT